MPVPSPAEAIAASIANPGTQASVNLNGSDAIDLSNQELADLPLKGKTQEATHSKDDKAAPTPKTESIRTLSSEIQSDEVPAATEAKDVKEEPTDEQRKDDKPAAYIKRLKQERDDARNEAKQIREKAAKHPEAAPEEIESLRKELAERDQILEETAYERTKAYKEKFTVPIEKTEKGTREMIANFTETKGVYEKAMALEGRERMAFLKEHVEDAASTVFDRMARIDELKADRDESLKNRAEISKTLASEREKSEQSEFLKSFDADREEVSKKLSPYRGENAESLFKQARSLVDGTANPEDVRKAAYLAAVAPHYIAQVVELSKKLAVYQARAKEDSSDRPSINGRGGDGSNGDASSNFTADGRIKPMREMIAKQVAERVRR